jgi:glycogen debranching enzyme
MFNSTDSSSPVQPVQIPSPESSRDPSLDQFDQGFPIIADSERPITPLRVLKHGDSFAVFDARGDIVPSEASEEGIYHDGTRFLSRFELLLFGQRPLLLSSTVSADNALFEADLTNPDLRRDGAVAIERGEINICRTRTLWNVRFVERIQVTNYRLDRLEMPISVYFDADFADVFEVRGTRRARRGDRLPDDAGDGYLMRYRGLDGRERRARVRWSRRPDRGGQNRVMWMLSLDPMASAFVDLSVEYEADGYTSGWPAEVSFDNVLATKKAARGEAPHAFCCNLASSSTIFNRWLDRSSADLQIMMTDTAYGPYPYAGIPWFSTPFGRDGIITAFEMLWLNPDVARGVLSFLARTQATTTDASRDSTPGKILHEMRGGEMAALGEVPFGCYYGSCDVTPLFVMLAEAHYQRTGDLEFMDQIWPHVVRALEWMDQSGDLDGDGFIEYARQSDTGLVQQGWKDSHDAVFHADGSPAEPPIALCEVQGYAYAAWKGAARLALRRGDPRVADDWAARAERLRVHFEQAYWCDDLGTYALALDGKKRQCRVRTSNPGHCLFAGIVSPERAERVCATLMEDASFAGWGVRTVAASERRYNPQSYHNGSIWPHDNALIAAGMSHYGFTGAARRILTAMADLSEAVDLHRLPELICGFPRRGREYPTLYPVACAPQAWAAGAVFLLLAASLGVQIDAPARRISFSRGRLPETLDWIRLTDLAIGDARVDVRLERHPHDVGVTVLRREGQVEIITIK